MTAIRQACVSYLENIRKSFPTSATYKNYKSTLLGSTGFVQSLAPGLKPVTPIESLTEEAGVAFIQFLLDHGAARSTRRRCAACLRGFYRFAIYEYKITNISVDGLDYALQTLHLLQGSNSYRKYPAEKIRRMLEFAEELHPQPKDLIMLRDLAFIFTLAQTGLRVHEACGLKIGDVDANFRATFIGKGGKPGTVSWGKEARARLNAYLKHRNALDESTGTVRSSLPLFARHDQTSGKAMVKPINMKIGEKIVHNMAALALGDEYDPTITCHMLRHYFGTTIYHETKDVKKTQAALRHSNADTTLNIYVHRNDEETAETVKNVFG